MGSPLTLTIANCYMFLFESDIVRQIGNSGGFYVRYIDDILISINWPFRHLSREVDQWNEKMIRRRMDDDDATRTLYGDRDRLEPIIEQHDDDAV